MGGDTKHKIVFVAGLHGNERAPVETLIDNGVDFILGSPMAYERDVRFVEKDLNASFGVDDNSHEAGRAAEILKEIDENNFVVDFHTTETEAVPFVIIVDERMILLAERTGIERVVLMQHNIKEGHALINHRNGISVETGIHGSGESRDKTLEVVKNVQQDQKYPICLYEVFDRITEPGEYINFQEHKGGFVPILANESEYELNGIYGLKARKL